MGRLARGWRFRRRKAGTRDRRWRVRRFGILVAVHRRVHPVGDGQVVHDRRQEVVGAGPLPALTLLGAGERAVRRQVPDQRHQAPGGERSAVPVEQVDAVVPQQVDLQSLGVLVDERVEAQPSPTPRPVSFP